jgi:hypothetical protein
LSYISKKEPNRLFDSSTTAPALPSSSFNLSAPHMLGLILVTKEANKKKPYAGSDTGK